MAPAAPYEPPGENRLCYLSTEHGEREEEEGSGN